MLNIPEEVKQLFRQGSVKKNIRVHFPNGEREDITNSNIISESFSFTESICSQDTLKFGLCEASMVEFECFNVGNIQNCKIEVSHEIDISTLGESFIEQYGQTSEDVAFPFYRVPYGVFVVDACPRQDNMQRRKIIAYSDFMSNGFELSEIEKIKQSSFTLKNADYDFDLQKFLYSNIPNLSEEYISSKQYISNVSEAYAEDTIYDENGRKATIYCRGASYVFYQNNAPDAFFGGVELPPSNLYQYEIINKETTKQSIEKIDEIIEKWRFTGFSTHPLGNIYGGVTEKDLEQFKSPHLMFYKFKEFKEYALGNIHSIPLDKKGFIYPYLSGMDDGTISIMVLRIPIELRIIWEDTYERENYYLYSDSFYKCNLVDSVFNRTMSLKRELNETYNYRSVTNTIDFRKLVEGYAELNAYFGRANRYGNFEFIKINDQFAIYPSETLYPADDLFPKGNSLLVTNYQRKRLWYEEYIVEKFGKVNLRFIDNNGKKQELAYVFDEKNKNVYNFENNYILENARFTNEEIINIIDTYFVPNVAEIYYTPAEIDIIGLPYLESGDTITVFTDNGGFQTFIFQRYLNGIQNLTDNFTVNGNQVNKDMFTTATNN